MVKKKNITSRLTFRAIRDSFSRYIAIVGIIALGCALFTGLKVCKTAMIETGYLYMERNGFFDYRLISTVGWDDESVEEIEKTEGIAKAEGMFTEDALVTFKKGDSVVKFYSLTDSVNTVEIVEGRMPQAPNECVADSYSLSSLGIGSVVTLSTENTEDTLEDFAYTEYTVVGTVRTPLYINFERGTTTLGSGSVSGFVCLMPEGFTTDYYSDLYVTFEQEEFIYTDEYETLTEEMEEPLQSAADDAAHDRFLRVKAEAEAELAEAEEEYNKGCDEYYDGLSQYRKYAREYKTGVQQYEDGTAQLETTKAETEKQLEEAYATLVVSQAALDAEEIVLKGLVPEFGEDTQKAIDALEKAVDSSANLDEETAAQMKELISGLRELTSTSGYDRVAKNYASAISRIESLISQIEESEDIPAIRKTALKSALTAAEKIIERNTSAFYTAYDEFITNKAKLESSWSEYESGKATAETEFANAEKELAAAKVKLDNAKVELAEAEAELEDAKAQLEEGEKQLEEARETIDKLTEPDVYLLDRTTNVGYVCFDSDTNIVDGIAKVFPLFFFAVAALVCITTMTRMVDDERGQLGTMKALGYSSWTIMARYLVYSGSASLIGCLIGTFGGCWLFPTVIWKAYGIMYSMPDITIVYDMELIGITTLSYVLLVLCVTWLCCRTELRQPAAELIRPKSPPAGKRVWLEHIGFIWKRLSFLTKVSVRNVFRYSKRLIMMVLGIGGCTALLLTGFGLNDSITHIADRQFDEIALYDASVTFTLDMRGEEREKFLSTCGKYLEEKAFMYSTNVTCTSDEYTGTVTLNAVEDFNDLEGLFDFHLDGEKVEAPGKGECIISKNLSEKYGIYTGDTISLTIGDTEGLEFKVTGVFANVIYSYVYCTVDSVSEQTGTEPELKNAYLGFTDDVYTAGAKVASARGVGNVSITQDNRNVVDSMLSSMKYIIILIICCAGALAFIVLFNLTNINILERIREIATIKVLGFNGKETSDYVYRENIILTGCGAAAGIPMGIWLHEFVMAQIKIDMISFEATRTPLSYILSIAITFVFTVAVNMIMLPKLEKINMAEALKSVE